MRNIFGFSVQTLVLAIILLAVVYVTLVGAAISDATHACTKFEIGCLLRNYPELAGGLIGAVGTIFAGWLAWFAIQLQMDHDRETSMQVRREAKDVALSELREILGVLNQMWRAIDRGIQDDSPERARKWKSAVDTLYAEVPRMVDRANLRGIAQELGPLDRQRLLQVAAGLDALVNNRSIRSRSEERQFSEQDKRHAMTMDRIMLSHIHQYLLSFDHGCAKIFHGRIKSQVDHRGMAAHLEQFMDGFERDMATR